MNKISAFFVLALLTAGFLWPSEAAIEGYGLHLAALWLTLAALHPIFQSQFMEPIATAGGRRSQLMTLGIALLLAGLWLSTWHIFQISGDRRAALNLAFEWSGIAAAWWLMSRMAASAGGRGQLTSTLVGLAFGIALVGIWQHHWLYKTQAEWYQNLTGSLERAAHGEGLSSAVEAARIRTDLQQSGVPVDGAARELFEQRLLSSSEPYGTFALANTLGGVLAVAIVLLGGCVIDRFRDRRHLKWPLLTIVAVSGLIITYCLMLTKSRTAWVGAIVGILALLLARTVVRSRRRLWVSMTGVSVVVIAASGIGLATGAIDKEVVLEAPRSLQFRLFYWTGAAGVIRENPIFGAGPGNFRQRYLAHKPVESSEEILDPHNIVLDVWSSAGLAGLAGFGLLLATGVTPLWRDESVMPATLPDPFRLSGRLSAAAVFAGWGLYWIEQEFSGVAWDETRTMTLAIPICTAVLVIPAARWFQCSSITAGGAVLALCVHLLGAGGLQITVVGLLLVALLSLTGPVRFQQPAYASVPVRVAKAGGVALAFAGLAAAVVAFGIIPVRGSASWTLRGDRAWDDRDLQTAETAWNRAAEADALAVTPWQRLTELQTYKLTAETMRLAGEHTNRIPETFADAIARTSLADVAEVSLAACDSLIRCDEWRVSGYHFRARQHRLLANIDGFEDHLLSAIKDQQRVLSAFPSNGRYWMELAEMQQAQNQQQPAQSAAEQALAIDAINRQWGHRDRYLSEDEITFLKALVGSDWR